MGAKLKLYSRKSKEEPINFLTVDWDKFEEDSTQEFVNIPVKHQFINDFFEKRSEGTTLIVENLRESWDRNSLIKLKESLSRLVNPHIGYEDVSGDFEIFLTYSEEPDLSGKIKNYVFESLNLKTTHLSVLQSEDGDEITTKIEDRGTFLFELKQKSKFYHLRNISIELFFLNRSAKISFRKLMGISPAAYGSILVYKNGFRIMPYGEPGADFLEIDRRKQQGFRRFLGTRDLMGRISIRGDNPELVESTSRDGGIINSSARDELYSFFRDYALFPLERYVVNLIKWGDPKGETEAVSPEDIKKDIIEYITNYEKKGNVIQLRTNPSLIDLIEMQINNQDTSDIASLRRIAKQYESFELDKLVDKVANENTKLRKDSSELFEQVYATTDALNDAKKELESTQKQALFLRGLANPRYENAAKSMHAMKTSSVSIGINANKALNVISNIDDDNIKKKINRYLYEIVKAVERIKGIYNTAHSADYDVGLSSMKMNITDFIMQFVYNALLPNIGNVINVTVQSSSKESEAIINPTEFGILIDNILVNAYKAKAKNLSITISSNNEWITIDFADDGIGLDSSISCVDRIFELGFTTTGGSGVGLAHSKKIIENMNGDISVDRDSKHGFKLKVRVKNEHKV